MKRTVKILLLLALSSAILSGCNTARGVGEDIQDLGHIISHAASYFRLIFLKILPFPSNGKILSILKLLYTK